MTRPTVSSPVRPVNQSSSSGNDGPEGFRALRREALVSFSPDRVHTAVTRHVSNWWALYKLVGLRALLGRRGITSDVCFVDRSPPLERVCLSEARYVLGSVCAARWLGVPEGPEQTSRTLLQLSREVRRSILSAYTLRELRTGAVGGWPGLKEILLYCVIRATRPDVVLETGVAQGVSTRFALEALKQNGRGSLVSVDLRATEAPSRAEADPTFVKPGLETGWLVPDRLRPNWKLIVGPAEEVLPTQHDELDLFCHDSLHSYEHMTWEYGWALQHLRVGGTLMSDDIEWNAAFTDFSATHSARLHLVSSRVIGVAVRTV
jgi:Methyltransferase domain